MHVLPLDASVLAQYTGCDTQDPWNCEAPLTSDEVLAANPVHEPYRWPDERPRSWHAGRVRALHEGGALNPVDVEIGADFSVDLVDGHHRLHAALLLGDGTLLASIGGWVDNIPLDLIASSPAVAR